MNKPHIFLSLKNIINDLYDSNMNKRLKVVGSLKNKGLSKESIEALYDLIEFILKYSVVGDITKKYICNSKATMKEIAIAENLCSDNEIKEVINKIAYDQRKIEAIFGGNILDEIFNNTINVDIYRKKIKRERDKVILKSRGNNKLLFGVRKDIIIDHFNGDFIGEYGKLLSIYSKNTVEIVERTLYEDDKFSGYFNYLCTSDGNMSKDALYDKDRLDKVLNERYIPINNDDNLFESIESIAVNYSIDKAIFELCNRLDSMEKNNIITDKSRIERIGRLMDYENSSKAIYNGKYVYITDRIVVICEDIQHNSQKSVNLDKILIGNIDISDKLDLAKIISEAKRISILNGVSYGNKAIVIKGSKFKIEDIEMGVKSIASSIGMCKVEYNVRYLVIHANKGDVIVMNSNDNNSLDIIENIDQK